MSPQALVAVILAAVALLLALFSLPPQAPQHPLLAVAVVLLCAAVLVPAFVR